jgi:lycopene cyclase domain-containing protein
LQYLTLMALCVAVTLPLELVVGARVYRRARRAALAILPVLVVFGVWDAIAIARHEWSFAGRYVTGVRVGSLPLEELVFFVVIPLCTLLTFEAVRTLTRSSDDA